MKTNYTIKSRVWFESTKNDKVFLGKGRVKLLKAIDEQQSLSKAAKSIEMSYKKAWGLIDSVNKSAESPITVNNIGGKGGGGTQLTSYGKHLISVYDEITENCQVFLDEQLKQVKPFKELT